MTAPATTCPTCSAPATGQFCSSCGTPLQGARCGDCGTALTPGAKFCHRCGTPAGTTGPRARASGSLDNVLPWAVAAIALVALIALVAAQRFSIGRASAAPVADAPDLGGATAPAPDISRLSPDERAERLFNRIMAASEQGDTAQVQFFAPMGVSAHQQLPRLTTDQRYHLGRIGEVAGVAALARAQADTILAERPTHLLGLVLAAGAARLEGKTAEREALLRRFLAADAAERRLSLPEYRDHQNDLAIARREAAP